MFGQVVIGAPGAGKTVYCKGMGDFLGALGRHGSTGFLLLPLITTFT